MLRRDSHPPSEGELAALADGTLVGERSTHVEAIVAASPELQAIVQEQRRTLSAVHAAAVPAPSALRARVAAAAPASVSAGRRRVVPALAVACVAAVALAVVLGTIGSAAPTVAQAAALAARPPTAAAPLGNQGAVLPGLRGAGLPYPYWEDHFGWRATGVRRDRLSGRPTTTVFYRRAGQRIGYTIVSGPSLSVPGDARVTIRNGTRIAVVRVGGQTVATWLRRGHSCVLSGAGVPGSVLVHLAAFRSHGALPY
ncbi:MAG: hypothetical protein ACR2MK_03440 [Solirubrobacteraceae bacterium]